MMVRVVCCDYGKPWTKLSVDTLSSFLDDDKEVALGEDIVSSACMQVRPASPRAEFDAHTTAKKFIHRAQKERSEERERRRPGEPMLSLWEISAFVRLPHDLAYCILIMCRMDTKRKTPADFVPESQLNRQLAPLPFLLYLDGFMSELKARPGFTNVARVFLGLNMLECGMSPAWNRLTSSACTNLASWQSLFLSLPLGIGCIMERVDTMAILAVFVRYMMMTRISWPSCPASLHQRRAEKANEGCSARTRLDLGTQKMR